MEAVDNTVSIPIESKKRVQRTFIDPPINSSNFIVYAPDSKQIYEAGDFFEKHGITHHYIWRCLFYSLYLTSARVSEILPLRTGNITKARDDSISFTDITLRNLKNRRKHTKTVPVCPLDEFDKKMLDAIWEVKETRLEPNALMFKDILAKSDLKKLKEGVDISKLKDPFASTKRKVSRAFHQLIFNSKAVNQNTGEVIFPTYYLHAHLTRSWRASALQSAGYTDEQLVQILGHSDSRTISVYSSINPTSLKKSIANVMRPIIREQRKNKKKTDENESKVTDEGSENYEKSSV